MRAVFMIKNEQLSQASHIRINCVIIRVTVQTLSHHTGITLKLSVCTNVH